MFSQGFSSLYDCGDDGHRVFQRPLYRLLMDYMVLSQHRGRQNARNPVFIGLQILQKFQKFLFHAIWFFSLDLQHLHNLNILYKFRPLLCIFNLHTYNPAVLRNHVHPFSISMDFWSINLSFSLLEDFPVFDGDDDQYA